MSEPGRPDPAFQAEVAAAALRAVGPSGFALAGGAALVAHGLTDRPTEDVDLFSPVAGSPAQVRELLHTVLTDAGYEVQVVRAHGQDFVRLHVGRDDDSTYVDIGRDWREHPPVHLDVGPVLHLDDAVANKVTAMLGRQLPRDYLDVAAASSRYRRSQLLRLAFGHDPGLRVADVALAMAALDREPDRGLQQAGGLTAEQVAHVRARFRHWPREPSADLEAHRAHADAHRPVDED